jgi:hypothetical protein
MNLCGQDSGRKAATQEQANAYEPAPGRTPLVHNRGDSESQFDSGLVHQFRLTTNSPKNRKNK